MNTIAQSYIDRHLVKDEDGNVVGITLPATSGKTMIGPTLITDYAHEHNIPIIYPSLETSTRKLYEELKALAAQHPVGPTKAVKPERDPLIIITSISSGIHPVFTKPYVRILKGRKNQEEQ